MLSDRNKQEWREQLEVSSDEAIVEWVEIGKYLRQYDRERLGQLIDWWADTRLDALCEMAEAGDAFSSSMVVAVGSLMAASPRIDGHVTRASELLQRVVPGLAAGEDDEMVCLALANLTIAQTRIAFLKSVSATTLHCAGVAARDKGKSLSAEAQDRMREALAEAERAFETMQTTYVLFKERGKGSDKLVSPVVARVSEVEKMMDRARRCAADDEECRRILKSDGRRPVDSGSMPGDGATWP